MIGPPDWLFGHHEGLTNLRERCRVHWQRITIMTKVAVFSRASCVPDTGSRAFVWINAHN